jgi:hypothetical protein
MGAKREYRFTVKTLTFTNGFPAGSLEFEEVPSDGNPTASGSSRPTSNTHEEMTEPQRRYLFRLLAAQGVEGKAAEDHLKDYFRVRQLKEVTRQAASQYIDQLVKDQKDGSG